MIKSLFIVQLAETSIPFSVKTQLETHLEEVVTSTMKFFNHIMAFLRIIVSENDKNQIMCSPYGTTFVTRSMFFQKITLLYGLEDSERFLKMFVSLLERMKMLSSFQLMIVYLSVFVSIIEESVFVTNPEEIGSIIRGFKIKIERLSLKFGLNEIIGGVIVFVKFYKQSTSFNEVAGRFELTREPKFDVCDKF